MDDGTLGYPTDYSKGGWRSFLEWFGGLIGLCIGLVALTGVVWAILAGLDALFY
jgi:hypothetical protein